MPDIIDVREAQDIQRSLGDLVNAHFPHAVCAFTSGSLPYGAAIRGHSDIDINIVFPARTVCDDTLVDDVNGFIDAFARRHKEHGLVMDRRYPGEYFTADQAWDAVSGRGVPVCEGRPRLPLQPDDDYWETTEETWYLAWLGALSFSHHAAGQAETLMALRRQGWQTLLMLCLPDLLSRSVTADVILERLMQPTHPSGGFGVHTGYRRFADLETAFIDEALAGLADLGYLRSAGHDYTVHERALKHWQDEFVAKHVNGFSASNLFTVSSSKGLAR